MTIQANAQGELIERDAWLDLFRAAPAQVVEGLGLSWSHIGGTGLLASTAVPINEFNRVMAVDVEKAWTIDDLQHARAWFAERSIPGFAIQVSPDARDQVRTLLSEEGAAPNGNGWAKFIRVNAGTPAFEHASGLDVIEVDQATAAAFGHVVQAGFGLPPLTADWFAALVERPGWSVYLAKVDGDYAGAGSMFINGQSAWLGADTTLAAARGRGIHRTLIARRLHDAWTAGVTVMTAETGRPSTTDEAGFSSYRNYRRSGFEQTYTRPNWKFAPGVGGTVSA